MVLVRGVVRDGVSTTPPLEPPAETAGSGTFTIATWNIRDGRGGGLVTACRALDQMGVDIAILQETKLTADAIYTRTADGYSIGASAARSGHQGGVALVSRESEAYELEETKFWGSNVLSFR
eukprot:7086099-Ditylum_brightwellii.AAC.1